MFDTLMLKRRFAPLFWAQFFSAFNDNFLKNALVFIILYKLAGSHGEALVTLAGGLFIAPFFLLSGVGGQMADRFDKALMAQRLKLAEIGAAAVAVLGFTLPSVPVLFVALVLFGVIAALFGPIKYGILPDHLKREELPAGNALIEGATFIAILLGTIAGGLTAREGGDAAQLSLLILVFALACWVATLFIPKTGPAAPDLVVDRNILRSTRDLLKDLWGDARLWRTGVMVSLFWLIGAVVMSLLPSLVKNGMGGTEMVVSTYLGIFAIAIAVGSGIGSFLSSGRIVLLPVPVAGVVMGLFALDLGWAVSGVVAHQPAQDIGAFFAGPSAWRVGIDLAGLAIAGGVFVVPSFAAAQAWAPAEKRARIVAAVNVLSAAFMVAGAVVVALLQAAGLTLSHLFLLIGVLTIAASVWILRTLPTNPLSDFLSILFRAFYRVEVSGRENIAKAGDNAIIALNHVSFLDAALALSILDKEPVFAIDHGIAQRWWVKPFLKLTRAMPLDPARPLATRSLINAVKNGESLVIFPEGRLTVTGSLMKVYDGVGMIAEKSGAQVVPVRIEGLEATIFSRLTREQVRRRWFPKVRVTVLEPVSLSVPEELKGKPRRQAAGAALYQIMSDLIFKTTDIDRSVFSAVAEAAVVNGKGRVAVEDPITGSLTYKRLLIGAEVLGRKLMPLAGKGEAIGVMLPNANGAAVTLLGLMSAARVPAMINFTAGATNIAAACKAAQVKTIVTSRAFVEKGRMGPLIEALQADVRIVYLEDVRATVTTGDKLWALWHHGTPIEEAKGSDRAAILFTSGSEGAPKGVVLSHRNMLANAAQAAARIDFGRRDKVFNVLPVFHSFGLTAGLVLPLVSGVPVYLYPSPLHYRMVPELVYGCNATILFGTDTFLTGYARAAHPYDLRSLRYIVAGAEPVKDTTRRTYAEKFGLRILEGYGVTETAPVLALNTPMFNRFGTVGRIMPGMEARLEPMPGVEEGGRLHVSGPNIMLGYLKSENPGVLEPPPEGWHDTGDIVVIDKDGFVTIKGRAKRFAKIAGEMVSLAAVEALAAECWPGVLSGVASLPDARKGERLVLVTQQKDATRAAFQAFAKGKGAADLMIPAEVMVVPAVPVLGSGKLDFAGISRLVKERAQAPVAAVVA
ncbi:Acyl-(acyl-carrier-protein)-phospholipid O-acyltransferase / long-chain-fatty-acid--(acyl-carrier-protein) ligase [Bosea sp. 62]|uniref:acyl-[ACP]--phospholipid O-acyltransferase n=1 Tax=unclassified Bosea (in: a-proteobacteria) TaxID=2653178 RepID=UPI0012542540|nr:MULTISPECIES: acyl-[ACP]--phospholipid O-acyltransferase [unclassified Bosea (in: a-proteobacteria)]CAD5256419.1 Acyl-(acyl-carrier-protein)-phospholipid O-acyltransferase / long-chain-fatty-acid--(acyl-carrier-protein) ligase [Bosea sp. 7B]CAD5274126.1 Acyl-(acyl-carrier-protein)-phospholipid O-acyltransferase / long-chain-fatty-acid--(acyl-carrier-protein) ligase [Bosea sp. 21B]CAD5284007.1 Acyl-(acyl-carrier-protein)-phospholipid O-acyltransferase / long-chain-fatty-acid--(acyl-carrier-pro